MIPKIIHYCWFGHNQLPKSAEKCINSWKKYCPDYQIIEWNEDNFDVFENPYLKMCYEQKKYAFLTDYVRLIVVERMGGVYFDTDVEVIRNFDELLNDESFFGFENNENVATGLGFGAVANNILVQEMIKEYDILLSGDNGVIGCPILNTRALLKHGLVLNGKTQRIEHGKVYSVDYFNPLVSSTGELRKTSNTYSIHWYSALWLSKKRRIISKIARPFHRIFGDDCFKILKIWGHKH